MFTFQSSVHLEFRCPCDLRWGHNFAFFHTGGQLWQHIVQMNHFPTELKNHICLFYILEYTWALFQLTNDIVSLIYVSIPKPLPYLFDWMPYRVMQLLPFFKKQSKTNQKTFLLFYWYLFSPLNFYMILCNNFKKHCWDLHRLGYSFRCCK